MKQKPVMTTAQYFALPTKGERISAVLRGQFPKIRSERERQLRMRYKMTLEDVAGMFESQYNKCKLCEKDITLEKSYIDHDHDTNKVRGIVCPRCNTLLGLLEGIRQQLVFRAWVYIDHEGNV